MLKEVLEHSLMISGFVFLMMLVVEYANVATRGTWKMKLAASKWGGYVLAVLLGVTPGCLGSFAVVTLYGHGVVSVGAVVAAMVATCGDEAFVMLAMFPGKAVMIMAALCVLGIVSGALTDVVFRGRLFGRPGRFCGLELHEEACDCFAFHRVAGYWRQLSMPRGVLSVALLLFVLGLVSGEIGHGGWNWVRVTLLVGASVGIFIVATVPDHFLEEHLWRHVAREHVPRVFIWTFGALLVLHLGMDYLDLAAKVGEGKLVVLVFACLVGLIPTSGPHLVFVSFFAQGTIPLSVLLANCVVQDGHGMLPLLAHSRRDFIGVKLVNLAVGLAVGLVGYLFGW